MKTAKKGHEILHLDRLNRSSYQQLHDEGKKGLLECPVCSETVVLFLGIDKDPHFEHKITKKPACQDGDINQTPVSAISNSREINGFQLPQSRSITSTSDNHIVHSFKSAKVVKPLPPFIADNKTETLSIHFPYIRALHNAQIYLDTNQAKAVVHPNGSLLVLAGAGSGKTRVLTARTAFLLSEQKVEPNQIMLVTFTAKAASEMKSRLINYPNVNRAQINRLVTGTFHSLFYRILCSSLSTKMEWKPSIK